MVLWSALDLKLIFFHQLWFSGELTWGWWKWRLLKQLVTHIFRVFVIPENTKFLCNICPTLGQRLRRWFNIVQMLYKYFVFTGIRLIYQKAIVVAAIQSDTKTYCESHYFNRSVDRHLVWTESEEIYIPAMKRPHNVLVGCRLWEACSQRLCLCY